MRSNKGYVIDWCDVFKDCFVVGENFRNGAVVVPAGQEFSGRDYLAHQSDGLFFRSVGWR